MALSPKGKAWQFLDSKITTNASLQLKLQQILLFLLVHGLTTIILVGGMADEDRQNGLLHGPDRTACHLSLWGGTEHGYGQRRIKLFGAPRQWKHFRHLFQAVFLSGGGVLPPDSQTPRLPVRRQK